MNFLKLFERFFHERQKPSQETQTQTQNSSKTEPIPPIAPSPAKQQSAKKEARRDLLYHLLPLVQDGRLVIPDWLTEIPDKLFDCASSTGDCDLSQLVSIVVPGTVKSIGIRAFEKCSNLEEIILCEGIERIHDTAFYKCAKLKRLQFPASLKTWGFFLSETAIDEPLFSADGKVLIYYPSGWTNSEYIVPEGVEEIALLAFYHSKHLRKVTLPQSLKRIHLQAFTSCHFTEIKVPQNTEIEDGAFCSFKSPVRIIRENRLNPLDEKTESCRANGLSFLAPQTIKLPQTQQPYWKDEDFQLLAKQCATGRVEAMERMGDYFFAKAAEEKDNVFYPLALHFWRTRTYRYGSKAAGEYLLAWCETHPDARMPSPNIDETLDGTADGDLLNALGFPFFAPDREYTLRGVDQDGVVEVYSWVSCDEPDEDGFGSENYYDWWYLDEYLVLPEGIGSIHHYSPTDRRAFFEKKFLPLHDQVAALNKTRIHES